MLDLWVAPSVVIGWEYLGGGALGDPARGVCVASQWIPWLS